jgi:class 3 adenylate cyclase
MGETVNYSIGIRMVKNSIGVAPKMTIVDDLKASVTAILATQWKSRDGRVVPEAEDVTLGNDAVSLNGTVLYADLSDSTSLVANKAATYAAEVYKCYLHCASKIIQRYNGVITAFDGDRVMAVYIGNSKNTNAVRSALAINHAVTEIINPRIEAQYPGRAYFVRQAVGIDTGLLLVGKTGVRRSNDLVWVGTAANIAAKLCALREGGYRTWITEAVYDCMHADVTIAGQENMWAKRSWTAHGGMTIYGSAYSWAVA